MAIVKVTYVVACQLRFVAVVDVLVIVVLAVVVVVIVVVKAMGL